MSTHHNSCDRSCNIYFLPCFVDPEDSSNLSKCSCISQISTVNMVTIGSSPFVFFSILLPLCDCVVVEVVCVLYLLVFSTHSKNKISLNFRI